jgi:hypothetical protein
MAIGASVGKGGVNKAADVTQVQQLLNDWLDATGQPLLSTAGVCGPATIAAITDYQLRGIAVAKPDGLVSPGGKTWTGLSSGQGIPSPLSGADWWNRNQAKYPNSARLADLASPFRENASAFVQAMRAGGASVTVAATRRSSIRAQLMHYSWRIAKGTIAPRDVPAIQGCRISWDHGDLARSKKGAQEMVDLFGIAYQPSLTSNHIDGNAIDMTIGWTGTIQIEEKNGRKRALSAPRSGESNTDLHKVGATYGVLKLLSDAPHWSDDGR